MLDGMAERWGSLDESLNTDLDDIDIHYGNDCVLVGLDGPLAVGTGILLLRATGGKSCGCQSTETTDDAALHRTYWRS